MSIPPLEQFKHAVNLRDAQELRRVLTVHADVRAAINDPLFAFDSPAIRELASSADTSALDVLLEFGADPNRKSSWWAGGFHPLYSASKGAAERLFAAGAIADACAAASLDRLDLLEQIVRADPSRVNERGGDGQTPLHFARSRAAIDFLLDHGADINARDVDHRSTAAEWMIGDQTALARYLVERGADADIFLVAALGMTERAVAMLEANPALLSLRTGHGEYAEKPPSSYRIYQWTLGGNLTPLQAAAKFGHHETVRAMSRFATPVQRLLAACNLGKADEARAIVRDHPGIVQSLAPIDRAALSEEAWAANVPAVELMLELGFDPGVASTGAAHGNALHCAAWEGSTGSVSALLRHPAGRALLESRDPVHNGTPLGWCAHGSVNCHNPRARHGEVARALIAAGASVTQEMTEWGSGEFQSIIRETLNR